MRQTLLCLCSLLSACGAVAGLHDEALLAEYPGASTMPPGTDAKNARAAIVWWSDSADPADDTGQHTVTQNVTLAVDLSAGYSFQITEPPPDEALGHVVS
jgi:hypothetical protein